MLPYAISLGEAGCRVGKLQPEVERGLNDLVSPCGVCRLLYTLTSANLAYDLDGPNYGKKRCSRLTGTAGSLNYSL
jgi:hypothetical protein